MPRPRTPVEPWSYLRTARIKKRKTLAMAVEEISQVHPISRQHLNQLELGWCGLSDQLLFVLADYYGIEPDELDATRPPRPTRVGEFAAYKERTAGVAA